MTTLIDQELDDADGSKKFSREPGRVSSPDLFLLQNMFRQAEIVD